eukprot:Opistho-2@62052
MGGGSSKPKVGGASSKKKKSNPSANPPAATAGPDARAPPSASADKPTASPADSEAPLGGRTASTTASRKDKDDTLENLPVKSSPKLSPKASPKASAADDDSLTWDSKPTAARTSNDKTNEDVSADATKAKEEAADTPKKKASLPETAAKETSPVKAVESPKPKEDKPQTAFSSPGVQKTQSKVSLLQGNLKLPMPGMGGPSPGTKKKDSASSHCDESTPAASPVAMSMPMGFGSPRTSSDAHQSEKPVSFDSPAAPSATLTVNKRAAAPVNRRAPSKPTRIYLLDESWKVVQLQMTTTSKDLVGQLMDKMNMGDDIDHAKYCLCEVHTKGAEESRELKDDEIPLIVMVRWTAGKTYAEGDKRIYFIEKGTKVSLSTKETSSLAMPEAALAQSAERARLLSQGSKPSSRAGGSGSPSPVPKTGDDAVSTTPIKHDGDNKAEDGKTSNASADAPSTSTTPARKSSASAESPSSVARLRPPSIITASSPSPAAPEVSPGASLGGARSRLSVDGSSSPRGSVAPASPQPQRRASKENGATSPLPERKLSGGAPSLLPVGFGLKSPRDSVVVPIEKASPSSPFPALRKVGEETTSAVPSPSAQLTSPTVLLPSSTAALSTEPAVGAETSSTPRTAKDLFGAKGEKSPAIKRASESAASPSQSEDAKEEAVTSVTSPASAGVQVAKPSPANKLAALKTASEPAKSPEGGKLFPAALKPTISEAKGDSKAPTADESVPADILKGDKSPNSRVKPASDADKVVQDGKTSTASVDKIDAPVKEEGKSVGAAAKTWGAPKAASGTGVNTATADVAPAPSVTTVNGNKTSEPPAKTDSPAPVKSWGVVKAAVNSPAPVKASEPASASASASVSASKEASNGKAATTTETVKTDSPSPAPVKSWGNKAASTEASKPAAGGTKADTPAKAESSAPVKSWGATKTVGDGAKPEAGTPAAKSVGGAVETNDAPAKPDSLAPVKSWGAAKTASEVGKSSTADTAATAAAAKPSSGTTVKTSDPPAKTNSPAPVKSWGVVKAAVNSPAPVKASEPASASASTSASASKEASNGKAATTTETVKTDSPSPAPVKSWGNKAASTEASKPAAGGTKADTPAKAESSAPVKSWGATKTVGDGAKPEAGTPAAKSVGGAVETNDAPAKTGSPAPVKSWGKGKPAADASAAATAKPTVGGPSKAEAAPSSAPAADKGADGAPVAKGEADAASGPVDFKSRLKAVNKA